MPSMPWFRFYSEAINDRKIKRACVISGQPKAVVMGAWLIILCLANESPERGRLLISEDMWLSEEEILAETGLDMVTFGKVVNAFQRLNMLTVGAGYEVCNWGKRQYDSDNSTKRVRAWREKQAQKQAKQSETLQKRYNNVIDQNRTESETESDQSYAAAVAAYEANIGVITKKAGEMIDDWIQEFGLSCTLDAITESGKRNAKTPAYVDKVIRTVKESATANSAYGEFTAWHAGRRSFGELPAAVQDKIRTLGGDGIRKQPAHYYKKEFRQVAT